MIPVPKIPQLSFVLCIFIFSLALSFRVLVFILDVVDMTDLQINTKLPLRRNRPGTKAKDWCHWPEETSENMDSLYHIQQVKHSNEI
jgi:hypothetical protein